MTHKKIILVLTPVLPHPHQPLDLITFAYSTAQTSPGLTPSTLIVSALPLAPVRPQTAMDIIPLVPAFSIAQMENLHIMSQENLSAYSDAQKTQGSLATFSTTAAKHNVPHPTTETSPETVPVF